MDLKTYLARKAQRDADQPVYRQICYSCRKAQSTCYCANISAIVTRPRIVILMHPAETRRAIATGRMAHRCLANSQVIEGMEFNDHPEVEKLLADPKLYPTILYPSRDSCDITRLSENEKAELFPADREPVLFVIDGTWHQARKMLYRSTRLHTLPRLSFVPSRLSGFKVRKQPREQCFSTIEAIHECLTLLSPSAGSKPQDILLSAFERMVEQQVAFRDLGDDSRHVVGRERRRRRRNVSRRAERSELPANERDLAIVEAR